MMADSWDKKEIHEALQQILPPAEVKREEDDLKPLTDAYHKYKREYVKQITFNPDADNLSIFFNFTHLKQQIYMWLFVS